MNYIVAVDNHWNIGKNNELLFNIPTDMRFFRDTTMGSSVIMGDRTFLSLPGAKPLKGRENIVLSLDVNFNPEGVVNCHSLRELYDVLKKKENTENVFVIGGATVYNLLMPYCEYAYITKIDAVREDADVNITDLDRLGNWSVVWESERMQDAGFAFSFIRYRNTDIRPLEKMI